MPEEWGVSTHRGRSVYVHVHRWPTEGAVVLPALERRIVEAHVLGGGVARVKQSAAGTAIQVGPEHRRPIDTIARLELDEPAGTLAPR